MIKRHFVPPQKLPPQRRFFEKFKSEPHYEDILVLLLQIEIETREEIFLRELWMKAILLA